MVETVYDLCQPSIMFNVYNECFPRNRGSSFFFPFGNLSLCDRKYQSDQNPERTQPERFPHRKPWGRPLLWPHLIVFEKNAYCVLFRTCSWRPHVHGCPPTIHFLLLVWEGLSTSNQNGGYHGLSDFSSSLLLIVVASGGFSIFFVKVGIFILKHLG